jgi:predicted Zn-dependent peptidase
MPRHDAPVVSLVTTVNTGCADDPKGAMGLAHMFEHMAFKGTKEIGTKNLKKEQKWMAEEDRIFDLILEERSKGDMADSVRLAELEKEMEIATDSSFSYSETNEFGQIVERHGGVGLNAGTGFDYTTYYISYPSNKLELWMAMESDRFLNPVLRELFKEKQVVAEERRYRVESMPIGRMLNEYLGIAYNSHPYGRPLIGEMSEIQNYNRPVMLEQFNSYYVPRNIAIGIVGDVDPEEVYKLAKKYFGKLKDRPKPKPVMIDEQSPFGVRKSTVMEKSQPMFLSGYHIPTLNHPDWIALDALASYLGSGRTSVLYKNLVKEKKSAVSVEAFIGYPGSKYPSLFSFYCMPSNESSNDENESEILAEIDKVRNELIPEAELEKIKAQAKASLINRLASNSGLASQLVNYELLHGDWRKLFERLDKVNALTLEDIKRVANTYLDPEKRFVTYLEKPEE